MSEYNEKLSLLVIEYLKSQGVNDFNQFKLANNGDGSDSYINKWGYRFEMPNKEILLQKIDSIPQSDSLECFQLEEVSKPNLDQNNSLFIFKESLCVGITKKLYKIILEEL